MSKEFKNMDELFQSAFAGEAADVPAFVKSNIDKKLSKGKRRKGFYLGGFLIGALVIAVIIYSTGNNAAAPIEPVSALAESTKSQEIIVDNGSHDISSPAAPTVDTSDDQAQQTMDETNPSSSAPADLTTNNSDRSSASSGSIPQGNGALATSLPSSSTIDGPGVSVPPLNQDSNTNLTDATNPGINSEGQAAPSDANSGNPADLDENGMINNDADVTDADTILVETPNETTIAIVPGEAPNPDVSIDEDEKYNPWMIGINGGINLARSNYIAPTQQEEDIYKQSTHDAPGSTFSIDARYRFNNSLTLGGGMGLTRFIENYYFYKNETNINTTVTWNYLYDSLDTSGVFPIIDSTATYNTDTTTTILYDQTGATKATYLQLPVSVGTQIIRNKFRFDLYLAARLNYLVSAGGGYIQNESFVLFDKSNSIFKTFYVDLLIGGAIHYNIAGGLYLSANCVLRPPLGTMYTGTTFNRSLQYTHLGIGLNWKF